jgi:hypothetical protein
VQVVLLAGFVLLGVTAWYAKKAVQKIEEEELERELAEQQQQQEEGEQQTGADVELGAAAAGGCKDVDAVPLGADQQQALKLQDSNEPLQGLPNGSKGSDSGADLQVLLRPQQP